MNRLLVWTGRGSFKPWGANTWFPPKSEWAWIVNNCIQFPYECLSLTEPASMSRWWKCCSLSLIIDIHLLCGNAKQTGPPGVMISFPETVRCCLGWITLYPAIHHVSQHSANEVKKKREKGVCNDMRVSRWVLIFGWAIPWKLILKGLYIFIWPACYSNLHLTYSSVFFFSFSGSYPAVTRELLICSKTPETER